MPTIKREYFYWVIIFFILIFVSFYIKELSVISFLLEKNQVKLDFAALIKFIMYDFVDSFCLFLSISLYLGWLTATIRLYRNNFFLFWELKGNSAKKTVKSFAIFFFSISIFLLILNQTIGKELKKEAEVIFEDELVRNVNLKSQFEFPYGHFSQLNENSYLYYSSLILDPIDGPAPKLKNLVFFEKLPEGKFAITTAFNAEVKNDSLLLNYPERFYVEFGVKEWLPEKLDQSNSGTYFKLPKSIFNAKKYPTVSLMALTIPELFRLKDLIGENSFLIWGMLLVPFLIFIFIPGFLFFITLKFFKISS